MAKYRYCDAPAALLTGDTLPVVDNTPSAAIPRIENIVALTSEVRSIAHWAEPCDDVDEIYKTYVKSVGKRTDAGPITMKPMKEIHYSLSSEFGNIGWSKTYGVIPKEWKSSKTFPIFDKDSTDHSAESIFFDDEGLVLPRSCNPNELSQVILCDDMRKAFYDASLMRRFFLKGCSFSNYTKWDDVKDHFENIESPSDCVVIGPLIKGDGNTKWTITSQSGTDDGEYDGYYSPSVTMAYDKDRKPISTGFTSGDYIIGLTKGYYKDTEPNGKVHLENSLTAFATFGGSYGMYVDGQRLIKPVSFVIPLNITYDGSVSFDGTPLDGIVSDAYSISFSLQLFLNVVDSWLSSNVQEWSAKRIFLTFSLSSIIVDSGIVKNYFNDPPQSWNWEPE